MVIRSSRHIVIPPLFSIRVRAPQAAAAVSWWLVSGATCLVAYQPKGAASLAASYSNLASPGTYDAALGAAPDWASGTGWTFNGTDDGLVANGLVLNRPFTIVLAGSQASSDAGGFLWTGGNQAGQGFALGLGTTFTTANDLVVAIASAIAWLASATAATLSGFVLGATTAAGANGVSAAYALYLDGTSVKSGNVGVYDTTQNFAIGFSTAQPTAPFTAKALAIYSSALTAPQMATLSAAMAAL